MIQGFKHKGLKSLYETGSQKGVFRLKTTTLLMLITATIIKE
jgi:hypothetical protein